MYINFYAIHIVHIMRDFEFYSCFSFNNQTNSSNDVKIVSMSIEYPLDQTRSNFQIHTIQLPLKPMDIRD